MNKETIEETRELFEAASDLIYALSTWEPDNFPDYAKKAYLKLNDVIDKYCEEYENR